MNILWGGRGRWGRKVWAQVPRVQHRGNGLQPVLSMRKGPSSRNRAWQPTSPCPRYTTASRPGILCPFAHPNPHTENGSHNTKLAKEFLTSTREGMLAAPGAWQEGNDTGKGIFMLLKFSPSQRIHNSSMLSRQHASENGSNILQGALLQ